MTPLWGPDGLRKSEFEKLEDDDPAGPLVWLLLTVLLHCIFAVVLGVALALGVNWLLNL